MDDKEMFKPLENFSAAEVAPQSNAAVRSEAVVLSDYEMDTVMHEWARTSNSRVKLCRMVEAKVLRKVSARAADAPSEPSVRRADAYKLASRLQSFADRLCNDQTIGTRYEGDEAELRTAIHFIRSSGRAADAPSEPSEPVAVGIDSISLRAASKMMCFVYKSMPEYSLKAKLQTAIMDAMEEYRPYSSVSAHLANPPSEPMGLPPISASTYGSKTTCELEQLSRTQRVVPDNLPRWIDNMKGSDPTIDSLVEYIVWQSRAADAPANPSELSRELREYAGNSGYSHNDYADIMRRAADALDSQPTEWNDAINAATGLLEKMGDSLGDHADYNHCEMTCCDSTRMHALSDAASAVFGLAREVSRQPTDDKRDDLIARLRNQVDTLTGRLFDFESKNGPNTSSQPSDGGVRND